MKKIIKLLLIFFTLFFINYAQAEEETLILLDASASMLEDFQGTPKYIAAIEKTKEILSKLPSNKAIGLRIIGISIDKSLYYLKTINGENCYIDEENNLWRVYNFVPNSIFVDYFFSFNLFFFCSFFPVFYSFFLFFL